MRCGRPVARLVGTKYENGKTDKKDKKGVTPERADKQKNDENDEKDEQCHVSSIAMVWVATTSNPHVTLGYAFLFLFLRTCVTLGSNVAYLLNQLPPI